MFASCILRQPWYFFLFFSSASGSWDGGSRAFAQLSLNVPQMFPFTTGASNTDEPLERAQSNGGFGSIEKEQQGEEISGSQSSWTPPPRPGTRLKQAAQVTGAPKNNGKAVLVSEEENADSPPSTAGRSVKTTTRRGSSSDDDSD
jgi:hypothetical protein